MITKAYLDKSYNMESLWTEKWYSITYIKVTSKLLNIIDYTNDESRSLSGMELTTWDS